ncbi:MAG: RNase adapter RapZ [Pseudomonadota bacterium]
MQLVVVTGLSGSGKSIALHTLEDQEYDCIDNLPIGLLETFVNHLAAHQGSGSSRNAVGIDARSQPERLQELPERMRQMRGLGIDCRLLFLEAHPEILIQRFSETRRRHPLSSPQRTLASAIEWERQILEPILGEADLRIDTSHTTLHELRDLVRQRVAKTPCLEVSLLFQSFGFKHGVPRDADFVFDMRCLPNPHWTPALRSLTGRDQAVVEFLEADAKVLQMRDELTGFLSRWIPHFEADGRRYLTIAIGCTGGQHRSVYMATQLAGYFAAVNRQVLTKHRELP